MTMRAIRLLATFLIPVACGSVEDQPVESTSQAVTTNTAQEFRVGVIINTAAGGKSDLLAAINLAVTQVNMALQHIGAGQMTLKAVVREYTNTFSRDDAQLPAIDLVNNQGVLGLIVDDSQQTIDVNELNYEVVRRINTQQVPVTCFQCSGDRIHSLADTAGAVDFDGWLFRTYFNAIFEGGLQAQVVRARVHHGDTNNDGFIRVVLYTAIGDHERGTDRFRTVFDQITPEPHSIETVLRSSPASDVSRIFDTLPDARPVDVVVMMMGPIDGFPGLTTIKNFQLAYPKPPIQLSEEMRRDAFLPALIATGLNLEGDSVLRVNNTPSGPLFKSAFSTANGHDPEITASYAYDSMVLMAGSIGRGVHFQAMDPDAIRSGFIGLNDPTGTTIRPRISDFETAARLINTDMPINYDGGGSKTDYDFFTRENYPDLVHWKIEKGKFAEKEVYGCDPDHPGCFKR